MQNTTTKEIVITGLSIALVFVATLFINIRLPIGQGGLIHLGNVPLFLVAIIFGKKIGALAGAFGMGLFDLMGACNIYYCRADGLCSGRYLRKER